MALYRGIRDKAEDIRAQSAGALDEAHSIINMLRNPATAQAALAPNEQTSLTRESIEKLLVQAKGAGMRLSTWVDIRQLGELDETIGKITYRILQESLTNARLHAPGADVTVEISATPSTGVRLFVSNPLSADGTQDTVSMVPATDDREQGLGRSGDVASSPLDRTMGGNGLPGIASRVHEANGTCTYGAGPEGNFTVEVHLPWYKKADERSSGRAALIP